MSKIKIISVPPGSAAPEKIRAQWINIEIPLIGTEDPKTPGTRRLGTENVGGYVVSPKEAIEALKNAGKNEAAEFWTRYLAAEKFVFRKDVCELIE